MPPHEAAGALTATAVETIMGSDWEPESLSAWPSLFRRLVAPRCLQGI